MPIFEYQCRACGNQFELLLLPTSPPPGCPSCESPDLEKLISHVAVSSEGSRAASRAQAMKRNKAIQHDKAHEEHKEYHRLLEEHG